MTAERAAAWLVAWLRVAPTVALLPWWGARGLHPWLRVAVACVLAAGVLPAAGVSPRALDAWLVVAALRELTLGVALAVVLAAPFVALRQAGALIDVTRDVEGGLAELLHALGAAVFLAAGAHRGVLRALAATWVVAPVDVDPRAPWPLDAWVDRAARATADVLLATVSIASSALLASLACELALAMVARAVPGRDVAALARPVRALVPLAALALTLALAADAARGAMQSSLAAARTLR